MVNQVKTAKRSVVKVGTFKVNPIRITGEFKFYEYKVEYLLGEGGAYTAPLEMYSVNDEPAELRNPDLLDLLDDEIRLHELKGTKSKIEYKSEQRGDEERHN